MDVRQIEYAPRPSNLRSRRVVRFVIWLAVLLLLLPAGVKGVPLAWHRAQLLYWQRKAMAYTLPPGTIALDEKTVPSAATAWDRFYQLYSPPGRVTFPTLFLHERQSAGGERRLVVVEAISTFHMKGSEEGMALSVLVVRPGTGLSPPEIRSDSAHYPPIIYGKTLRIYAGQVDPGDPSHFSIRGESDGKAFVIDGWLRDDDTVSIDITPGK